MTAGAPKTLIGWVSDEWYSALADVMVEIEQDGRAVEQVRSSASGRVETTAPAGDYRLTLAHPGLTHIWRRLRRNRFADRIMARTATASNGASPPHVYATSPPHAKTRQLIPHKAHPLKLLSRSGAQSTTS